MDPLHHKQETLILTSPVTGRAADLDQTPDTYFASGLMGAGAVLFPREGRLLAPCDAVVNFVFPKNTPWASGLQADWRWFCRWALAPTNWTVSVFSLW